MDVDNQVLQPLKIRAADSKNLFILICWGWLRDIKIIQPNNVWNDLVFAKWHAPHSLTRRLGIALNCKEIANSDATNKIPDRYRKYWKSHPEFFSFVFSKNKPDLLLPLPPYELPIFSINHPYPTIQSTSQDEFIGDRDELVEDQDGLIGGIIIFVNLSKMWT